MYYSLETDGAENVYVKKERGLNSHVELAMGVPWDVQKDNMTLPYRYAMKVNRGAQPKFYGWYPGSDLMQQRLVDVLRATGVDNLQSFPAEITRSDTNEKVEGYVAANIVGRVSCADLGSSKTSPLANVYYFHNLVIDPTRTHGLLMFRVAESPMVVLVQERVAKAIEAGKFLGLVLKPVSETPPAKP